LPPSKLSTSFSWPRTSNENLFIESFFKTLKYSSKYPLLFRDIEHARDWMADFVNWYNTEHLHLSKWTELYENKLQKGDIFVDTKRFFKIDMYNHLQIYYDYKRKELK